MRPTYATHAAAQAVIDNGSVGGVVCVYVDVDGNPKYFIMPAEATDDEVREAAFEVREGEPMSQYQRDMIELAKQVRP